MLDTIVSKSVQLFTFESSTHLTDRIKQDVFIKPLFTACENYGMIILLGSPFDTFLEFFLIFLVDQIYLVPDFYILFL